MLHCVLYIFLGGTAMISSGCTLDKHTAFVDRIEYVDEVAPQYEVSGYTTYYTAPYIVWTDGRYRTKRYYRSHYRTSYRYPYWRHRTVHPNRYKKRYPRRYKPHRVKKVKVYNRVPFSKYKKKKHKKKRRK